MTTHATRVYLRVALKLMVLGALLAGLTVAIQSLPGGSGGAPPAPISVNLAALTPAKPLESQWGTRRVLVLARESDPTAMQLTVIFGYGSELGCSLRWIPAVDGARQGLPEGGFIDPCDQSRYDARGQSLSPGVADLTGPPFFLDGDRVVIGIGNGGEPTE